ncbi:hypothetical protein B1L11_09640 [Microbispora sp. GKU 823]|nr:hypothetical protein B1L11_09640 [Microbispora sp. GKU 823]
MEIGDPDTAVVLVSAGSSDLRANATIAAVAREWARTRPWWSVTAAYASAAAPTPRDEVVRLTRAGAPKVVVAPYLLAPGYFADAVERDTLEAGAHAVAGVLGPAPELVALLLERHAQAVRAASAGRVTYSAGDDGRSQADERISCPFGLRITMSLSQLMGVGATASTHASRIVTLARVRYSPVSPTTRSASCSPSAGIGAPGSRSAATRWTGTSATSTSLGPFRSLPDSSIHEIR